MKNSVLKDFDPSLARLITGIALLCAVEVLIVFGIISFHVPFKSDPALQEIFFHYRKGYMPERELQLYAVGIALTVTFFFLILHVFRRYLAEEFFRKSLLRYGLVHLFIVIAEMIIIFSLIITPTNSTASVSLYSLLGLSVIIKIFYSEINTWLGRVF